MDGNMTAVSIDFSPVRLSYAAALRGVKPRNPGTEFSYARVGKTEITDIVCLAASNPEGRFFVLLPSIVDASKAQNFADSRQVENISFLSGSLAQLRDGFSTGVPLPDSLDYICCDETGVQLSVADRADLFSLAERRLKPNGLLAYSYNAYNNADEILRFLVREFVPEMNAEQAKDFLKEIKSLGTLYFSNHPIALAFLNQAIENNNPEEFFKTCTTSDNAKSGTFDTMTGLLPKGFAFAGDADISANYLELATPQEAHEILINCRQHLLYEPIKDFAMQRLYRNDIWCRMPVEQTEDSALLFGAFTYGVTKPKERLPLEIKAIGKTVDLRQPLFVKLIEVMTSLPMGIGDFLKHPNGNGINSSDVVAAIHTLVATGVAEVMRGRYEGKVEADVNNPKWTEGYNRYLDNEQINSGKVLLASTIIGNGISLSAREALVMQAINRVGMADSVSSLLAELHRVASNPYLASQIMDLSEPDAEMAANMIRAVVDDSLIRWYAYGLLAA